MGFADGSGSRAIPGWLVEYQTIHILRDGNVSLKGFPWQGRMVARIVETNLETVSLGFYVESSPTIQSSSTIGRGDVIVEINGKYITEQNLAISSLFAPDETVIRVLRN